MELRAGPTVLIGLLLVGCKGAPAPTRATVTPTPAHATSAPTVVAATPLVTPVAPIIGDAGASLVGKVKAPASIISDNGAAVVGNNGAGYRLADVPAQVPVVGATVRFTDAAGVPLKDAQGVPLTAVTDAQGAYSLAAPLPAHNVLATVNLGAKGALQAVAAPGAKQVDIELVSTLTTGYILDQYVMGDPVVLDKLPAAVEAQTRGKAAAAVVAVPDALTRTQIVAAVEALRKRDKSFDDQMEVVKRLLVAAGQSDLGAGQAATDVLLSAITTLAVLPGGDTFFGCPDDGRLWRLGADGVLRRATAAEGTKLVPVALAPDGADGLLVLEAQRLVRVDLAGGVKELWKAPWDGAKPVHPQALALARQADGRVLVLAGGSWDGTVGLCNVGQPVPPPTVPARLYQAGQDAPLHTFTAAETNQLTNVVASGVLPTGPWRLGLSAFRSQRAGESGMPDPLCHSTARALLELDPVTFALKPASPPATGNWTLDQAGAVVAVDDLYKQVQAFGGNVGWDQGSLFGSEYLPYWSGAEGVAATGHYVVRAAAGKVSLLAGATRVADVGDASQITFVRLTALAANATGQLAALDSAAKLRLWSIPASGTAKVVHDFDAPGLVPTGHDFLPKALRLGADGTIYAITDGPDIFTQDGSRLWKVAPDGTAAVVAGGTDGLNLLDFVPRADGSTVTLFRGDAGLLLRRQPAGGGAAVDTAIAEPTVGAIDRLAVVDDQTYYLAGRRACYRWTAAGLTPLGTGVDWLANMYIQGLNDETYLAVDGKKRLYGSNGSRVWRFDPGSGKLTAIAGVGAAAFHGDGTNGSTGFFLSSPAVDGQDTLYFLDPGNRQIKRLPAAQQPPDGI
ncbi:MAG: repeat-containing protein [Cyanobacteria bacterium RYN_339]|nr:repeat-containing protein [Cyanobacteria bacterium RYN_339]